MSEKLDQITAMNEVLARQLGGIAAMHAEVIPEEVIRENAFEGLRVPPELAEHALTVAAEAHALPGIQAMEQYLLEAGDIALAQHQRRVALIAIILASMVGKTVEEQRDIAGAAYIHDVGKLNPTVSRAVDKTGPWTDDDRRDMQEHVAHTIWYARKSGVTNTRVLDIAASHHEGFAVLERRYGPGLVVPEGSGADLESKRILTVADEFDALQDPSRRYRGPESPQEAVFKIRHELDVPQNVLRALVTIVPGTSS